MGALPTGSVTFFFADVEGSTRLARELGPDWQPVLGDVRRLLREAVAAADGHEVDARGDELLAAFGTAGESTPANQDLIDPLSERELGVLRLLGTDLDGAEIARTLVVSVNTMRTHTKSIYSKLGVNTRRAAVRRAEDLQLLTRGGNETPDSR